MENPIKLKTLLLLLSLLIFSGCSSIKVQNQDSRDYISQKRGDILTTGKLSSMTVNNLQLAGITANQCRFNNLPCIESLMALDNSHEENQLAALAELWMQRAILLSTDTELNEYQRDIQLTAYLEAVRFAYGYLFLTQRTPHERALEDRQIQVRDYYNFATQQITLSLFNYYREQVTITNNDRFVFQVGDWQISGQLDEIRLAAGQRIPDAMQAASSLRFSGLRNQYIRQGLGAGLVAIVNNPNPFTMDPRPWSETAFSPLTSLLLFQETNLDDLITSQSIQLHSFDPYQTDSFKLKDIDLPLEADFTSPYALWLANSKFSSQALLTLVGLDTDLQEPHIFMMQPYDPNRRIILMLHGLASSPQAWVNLANELLGDPTLRENYQIWQVYYPTNVPLMFNRLAIQQAIEDAITYFDPNQIFTASSDMVIIGHSMGGVLARLLVSESPQANWENWLANYNLNENQRLKAETEFKNLFTFKPTSQVGRAIFISAPHQGTPVANYQWVRWLSRIITLPVTLIGKTAELINLVVKPGEEADMMLSRSLNSIDNLRDDNPFLRMTTQLQIKPGLPYHSIIGQQDPLMPLVESTDGLVPYSSAYLAGAQSEKVIIGGHSIQETPEAIIEIRRILTEHIKQSLRHN